MKFLADSLSLWTPSDEDLVVLPGNLFQCFTVQRIILKNKVQSWKASKCEWKHLKINTVLYKEKIGVQWHWREIPDRFNAWSRSPYSSRSCILFLNSFISALLTSWPHASISSTFCALGHTEASFGVDWLVFGVYVMKPPVSVPCCEYLSGMEAVMVSGASRRAGPILSLRRNKSLSLWPLSPCVSRYLHAWPGFAGMCSVGGNSLEVSLCFPDRWAPLD